MVQRARFIKGSQLHAGKVNLDEALIMKNNWYFKCTEEGMNLDFKHHLPLLYLSTPPFF